MKPALGKKSTCDDQAVPRAYVKVIKQRITGDTAQSPEMDFLAIEDPLEIELCAEGKAPPPQRDRVVTMRTPGNDLDLIHGLLFSEGIIQCASDILSVEFNPPRGSAPSTGAQVRLRNSLKNSRSFGERAGVMQSSCGACGRSEAGSLALPPELCSRDDTRIGAEAIHLLPDKMYREQTTFRQTGGLHAASIYSSDGVLLATREDIGRHNALDKAVGASLIAGHIPGTGLLLCVSGRMSYDILQKAILARIPIIAGVGAPSSLAVTLASDFNITLIGFVRDGSYNIYSCPHRLRTRLIQ